MRIVGGLDDRKPDHWKNQFQECPKVYVNGIEMDGVCEADDTAGFVVVVEKDTDGKLKLTPDGQSIATTKISGRIDILGPRLPMAVNAGSAR